MRMIWARVVSAPTAVARMRRLPAPFTVPPVTASPWALATGSGSPVSMLSSMKLSPSSTSPSVGTRSPGRTTITSPDCSASAGTSTS